MQDRYVYPVTAIGADSVSYTVLPLAIMSSSVHFFVYKFSFGKQKEYIVCA